MTAKLPASVLVAGARYALETVEPGEIEGAWGETDPRHHTIRLEAAAPQPRTALHELLHASAEALHTEVDHDHIAALAAGLAGALVASPELVAWLVAAIEAEHAG